MTKKKGLGRGLGALIQEAGVEFDRAGSPLEVRVEAILPNPHQPRTSFKSKDLKTLANSIRERGVLEPLLVRRTEGDGYELIAGERRLRAAKEAGLTRVPVIIRDATPAEMLELALIENLHREDLNPIEEAESFHRLTEEFGRTHEDIARLAGRDRSTVANLIRLLGLPSAVQDDVRQGRLSAGHARALLSLVEEDRMLSVREMVLTRSLTVRQTEALVKKMLKPARRSSADQGDDAYFEALAQGMTRALGSKVRVIRRGKRGRLEITYNSNEELERLMAKMGVKTV